MPLGPSSRRCPKANKASHQYGYDGDFDNFGGECDGACSGFRARPQCLKLRQLVLCSTLGSEP